VTEADWDSCTDPKALLTFLPISSKLANRKARLLAVACCRRVWPLLTDDRSRRAVEVAERYADGLVTEEEREQAQRAAAGVGHMSGIVARWAAAYAPTGVGTVIKATGQMAARLPGRYDHRARRQAESAQQCKLLRDIFGIPFRPLPCLALAVLQWHGGLIRRLAEQAYQQRQLPSGHLDPERLAVLADALEEAEADADLVAHLRQPGPHVRGCHVVDLLTGRE
jgi:hypothetical protein